MREAQRKARADLDDEHSERMKVAERRWLADLDDAKTETVAVRKKLDDALRQAEEARRRVGLSKEDGRSEAQGELDAARERLRELDSQVAAQGGEIRRLRDEQASLAGRLAGALQSAQVRGGWVGIYCGEGIGGWVRI